jgi:hypothetical protein
MAKKPPHPKDNPFAGLTKCLRCDRRFHSWDRRHNRLCPSCTEILDKQPSPAPVYRVSKRHLSGMSASILPTRALRLSSHESIPSSRVLTPVISSLLTMVRWIMAAKSSIVLISFFIIPA